MLANEAIENASDRKANDLWTVIRATGFLAKNFKDFDLEGARADAYKSMGDVGSAAETLMDNPDDPDANMNAGMSVGFVSNQLKRLCRCLPAPDDDVKRLLKWKLPTPKLPSEMKQVADIWYESRRHARFPRLRNQNFCPVPALVRKVSAKQLKGVDAAMVKKRVAELEKKCQSTSASGT